MRAGASRARAFMATEQKRADKLEEIKRYLEGRFSGYAVTVVAPDTSRRRSFLIVHPADLSRSRQLGIPMDAVDDLDPAEIIALLEHPDTEPPWVALGVRLFGLVYDPLSGLSLPP